MKNQLATFILGCAVIGSMALWSGCKTNTAEIPPASWKQGNSSTTAILLGMDWVTPQNGYMVGFGGTILHTTDGGQNWTAQSSGTTQNLYQVSFGDANTGIAAGNNAAIVRTTDGGAHWLAVSTSALETIGSGTENIRDLKFLDPTTAVAVGGVGNTSTVDMQGCMIVSNDGGATWKRQSFGSATSTYATLYAIGLVPHNTLQYSVAGAQDQILTTNDAGRSWSPILMQGSDFYAIDYIDALQGLAVTAQGHIYRTGDAGVTWSSVYSGSTELRTVRMVSETEAWAAGINGTVLHSSDGGRSWVLSPIASTSNTWNDIVVRDENHIAFIGNGGALWWRSND